jgi:hypothetical protein
MPTEKGITMNLTPYIMTAALTLGGIAQCEGQPAPSPEVPAVPADDRPPCPPIFMTDDLDNRLPCNMQPGGRLDYTLYTLPDAYDLCDDMGGEVIFIDPLGDSLICSDVDF